MKSTIKQGITISKVNKKKCLKNQRFDTEYYFQMVIRKSRITYKVYTWGGWIIEDKYPTLKLGDACLLGPLGLILLFLTEESATTTSLDQDVNK